MTRQWLRTTTCASSDSCSAAEEVECSAWKLYRKVKIDSIFFVYPKHPNTSMMLPVTRIWWSLSLSRWPPRPPPPPSSSIGSWLCREQSNPSNPHPLICSVYCMYSMSKLLYNSVELCLEYANTNGVTQLYTHWWQLCICIESNLALSSAVHYKGMSIWKTWIVTKTIYVYVYIYIYML